MSESSSPPPIRFEEEELPSSLTALSILINEEGLSEGTKDWIWTFVHCIGCSKSVDAIWCQTSAGELIDYLIENRNRAVMLLAERMRPHGFEAEATFAEWLAGLLRVQERAGVKKGGECEWSALPGDLDQDAFARRTEQALDFFDRRMNR